MKIYFLVSLCYSCILEGRLQLTYLKYQQFIKCKNRFTGMQTQQQQQVTDNSLQPVSQQFQARGTNTKLNVSIQDNLPEEDKQLSPFIRKRPSLIIYFLVCLFELVTIFLGLLLFVLHEDNLKYAYLTFIIVTCFRVLLFTVSSRQLLDFGKEMFLLYFCFDNVMLMMVASDITYIFLNYKKQVEYVKGALVSYPFLYFFLCGNGRVMLKYALWHRWQVLLYKLVKLIGCCYYIGFGCYMIINESYNQTQAELFLLWIFTASAFWADQYKGWQRQYEDELYVNG